MGTNRSFNLTELHLLALDHTLRGVNDSRIAEILGITRRTLWNWKTFNEDYRRALAEGRAALHAAVVDRLQAASAKSLDALDDLLDDCDPKTRLHAAQISLRAAAALKPNLPNLQYHSPQSLHVGIVAPPQQSEVDIAAPPEIESFEQLAFQLPATQNPPSPPTLLPVPGTPGEG